MFEKTYPNFGLRNRLFCDTNHAYEAWQCKANGKPRDGGPYLSHRSRKFSPKYNVNYHRNSVKGVGKHLLQHWVKTYSIIKRILFNNYQQFIIVFIVYLLLSLSFIIIISISISTSILLPCCFTSVHHEDLEVSIY